MPRWILLSAAVLLLSGCSTIQNLSNSLAKSFGETESEPKKVATVPACSQQDITGLRSLYIDSSRPYYSGGSIFIYGRDGSRCLLPLRYLR